ncbi:MAG: glycosyltransferase [Chloroflexi bacterium]|nr:MAG: glycosyltransferase [Chloroflexota bacterium]
MAEIGTVAVIFPLFNERHAIAALVRRVPPTIAETIVVDDGSDDGGPELAREAGARVISQASSTSCAPATTTSRDPGFRRRAAQACICRAVAAS